jgi:hypothetical protein
MLIHLKRLVADWKFRNAATYWERRYRSGGRSGAGSYSKLRIYKADVVNTIVKAKGIESIIEWGCGDGNQLALLDVASYTGVDVSRYFINQCKYRFSSSPGKTFLHLSECKNEKADMAISLDVIYHLDKDEVYSRYMENLFNSALRYVLIYSSNKCCSEVTSVGHVKHRRFTDWIGSHNAAKLESKIDNVFPYTGNHETGSWSDFYLYAV